MSRHALIDADGAFTGRIEEFDETPELAPNKGSWVLLIEPPCDPVTQVAGDLQVAAGGAAVVREVRSKTADEVAAMRAGLISAIKAEARRRILLLYPDWKQMNMTARGVELTHIQQGRDLTSDEQTEAATLLAAWGVIKSIRTRSDQLEASAPNDAAAIAAFDVSTGWD